MESERKHEDLDSSTRFIIEAALKRGIQYEEIIFYQDEVAHEIYRLISGDVSHMMDITSPDLTSSIANTIADNKYLTHKVLDRYGAPCARCDLFTEVEPAVAFFRTLSRTGVVKPVYGGGGDGVSVDIEDEDMFIQCFLYAQTFSQHVLVEEFHSGIDTRFLVVNGKVEAVSQRSPAFVIGDGVRTIQQLIDDTNRSRADGRKGHLSKIRMDKIAHDFLEKKQIKLDLILPQDEQCYVRPNANLNTGGVSRNIDKGNVCAETIRTVETISKKIGLFVAGVDVQCKDISKPLQESDGIILEVNDRPRIRMHEQPYSGPPVAVSEKIIDMLFPHTKK